MGEVCVSISGCACSSSMSVWRYKWAQVKGRWREDILQIFAGNTKGCGNKHIFFANDIRKWSQNTPKNVLLIAWFILQRAQMQSYWNFNDIKHRKVENI